MAVGASIGILFGVVVALVTAFIGPFLLHLSEVQSADELWWTGVDLLRRAEDWLGHLGGYQYQPAYELQHFAMSPLGVCLLLAIFGAVDLLRFTRKRE